MVMITNLYETLGLQSDAKREDIRKAYRRLALQTHPDRLPPNSSESDKKKSEEAFRKVNNAYEVLIDEEKRKAYDRYGQWPPEPREEPSRRHRHHQSHSQAHSGFRNPFFDDSFFNDPFSAGPSGSSSRRWQSNGFTDPFTLFNSIFGDMQRQFEELPWAEPVPPQSFHGHFGPSPMPFAPFAPFASFDMTGFPRQFSTQFQPGFQNSFQSSSAGFSTQGNNNGQWISQSRMMRSINGVTESIWKRTDSRGNEHTTYSYPDGRERYFINGVEQPTSSNDHSLPPPPPYSSVVPANTGVAEQTPSRVDRNQYHQNRYNPTKHSEYGQERAHPRNRSHHNREREHKHRDSHERHGEHEHEKKRWWKGQ